MKNDIFTCINATTFKIEKMKNYFIVDKKLANTISILNKKGYYTEICDSAKLFKPFLIANIIHNLIEEKLIEINDEVKEKLKKVIDIVDYESTIIIFKDKYLFNKLPEGFKVVENGLYYNLKILKDSPNIEFKSLVELEIENEKSLKALETWADKLPIKKDGTDNIWINKYCYLT